MKIKIDKITFKNNQAWVVLRSEKNDEYLGTWHVNNKEFVNLLQVSLPKSMELNKE